MKAILEFTLPDEQEDHLCALHGSKYLGILQDLDNELRAKLKYHDAGKDVEEIRARLHALMDERGLSLWG